MLLSSVEHFILYWKYSSKYIYIYNIKRVLNNVELQLQYKRLKLKVFTKKKLSAKYFNRL